MKKKTKRIPLDQMTYDEYIQWRVEGEFLKRHPILFKMFPGAKEYYGLILLIEKIIKYDFSKKSKRTYKAK